MCGIAGFLHFDNERTADKNLLERITNVLIHRGPDGSGYYCNHAIALGHRRLSIIDLATGHQPMFNHDKSLAIVFNGEIYNYIELREELKKWGHHFTTDSDTEVILKSYEQWGFDCQNKFNGMWAFALWDERKKRLFISRDRIGEKPLYYSLHDSTFIFGSEIKSILAYGVSPAPRLELTELYFSLGYIPAPYTFYKHISKLQAGHYLIISEGRIQEKMYWDFPSLEEGNMMDDKKQVYETFENLLHDAVKIRMRSDVPFGAFLSGGLDSSSIVALMSEISPKPVQTFTIGFKEKMFDESKLAREVAQQFKTNHHEEFLQPESFDESLQKVAHQFDEPFGDSSAIPTGNVSRIAREKVKMVLTGDGGDEVLSGYNSHLVEKFAQQYQVVPSFLRSKLPALVSHVGELAGGNAKYKIKQVAKALEFSNQTFMSRLISKSWCNPQQLNQLIAPHEKQIKLPDFLGDFFSKYPVQDPFYKLMLFQTKILLPDDFLTKVDRMSMAASLETRVPFLDFRLVEFMAQVHKNIKMQGYERKSVLRNTLGKRLPPSLLKAPKRGFSIPLRDWFKAAPFEGRLQNLASANLGLNQQIIKEIIHNNHSGREDNGNLIWMLFIYQKWIGA
jgi:asparagine synthase (glutamine-hydrolysing)